MKNIIIILIIISNMLFISLPYSFAFSPPHYDFENVYVIVSDKNNGNYSLKILGNYEDNEMHLKFFQVILARFSDPNMDPKDFKVGNIIKVSLYYVGDYPEIFYIEKYSKKFSIFLIPITEFIIIIILIIILIKKYSYKKIMNIPLTLFAITP